jgi:hypothetical protein
MNVLVVDIGGSHVKILATGQDSPRLEKRGKKKWRKHVVDVVEGLVAALEPDDVVLGGGNVKLLKALPAGCRMGNNANAFLGGFRLWEEAGDGKAAGKKGPGA